MYFCVAFETMSFTFLCILCMHTCICINGCHLIKCMCTWCRMKRCIEIWTKLNFQPETHYYFISYYYYWNVWHVFARQKAFSTYTSMSYPVVWNAPLDSFFRWWERKKPLISTTRTLKCSKHMNGTKALKS